jgi:hypothetical protein
VKNGVSVKTSFALGGVVSSNGWSQAAENLRASAGEAADEQQQIPSPGQFKQAQWGGGVGALPAGAQQQRAIYTHHQRHYQEDNSSPLNQ